MENDEENEKIKKEINKLEEYKKQIDEASTWDMYKWLFAKAIDERNYKKEKRKEKKKSDSLIKRIMNKFNTAKDDEDVIIEEESNDKPKNDE